MEPPREGTTIDALVMVGPAYDQPRGKTAGMPLMREDGVVSTRTVPDPELSVVVPHYGAPHHTVALVSALLPQLAEADAELIVVDDASPVPLPDLPAGVKRVRRDHNGGFGATVNTGVTHARGRLVAILNSDLVVPDRFLADFVAAARPWMPALVAPRVVTPGHVGSNGFRFPSASRTFAQRFALIASRRHTRWGMRLIGEDPRTMDGGTHVTDWVSGAAMLLPTDLLRSVGGFDEMFHMYMEEVDLQRRLRDLGVPSVYVGGVVTEHVGFGSTPSDSREMWHLESAAVYAAKWGSVRRLRLALVAGSAATMVYESARRCAGRPVHPWREFRHSGEVRRAALDGRTRRA